MQLIKHEEVPHGDGVLQVAKEERLVSRSIIAESTAAPIALFACGVAILDSYFKSQVVM